MSTPFDSHKYAKRLMEAGLSPALADVQAETTAELMNELSRISTKLEEVDIRTNARIDQSRVELEAKIAESRVELVRWVVGIALLQSSFFTGLVLKLMP
ncbi:hypothetical protein [Duganella radicis]|uniref:DUF1640 domain-containing protein n=1 Tax=Duganella radicis TaxID=551988 RepID=A0A6L6PGG2_9BURK|nr:hypothetical protein [Duganella radicis]MTV37375.1 hypothetical protein [Duganella radicis]